MFRQMMPLLAPEDKSGKSGADEDTTDDKSDKKDSYTQAEVDAITKKVRKTAKQKADADWQEKYSTLEDRLKKLENPDTTDDMSDVDKKIAAAVKGVKDEWEGKYNNLLTKSALKDGLLEQGVHPQRIAAAAALADTYAPGKTDAEEVADILKDKAAYLFGEGESFGPKEGGNHKDGVTRGDGWTPAKVDKATEGMTGEQFDAFMKKHGDDIEADSQKISSMRSVAPGEPITKE